MKMPHYISKGKSNTKFIFPFRFNRKLIKLRTIVQLIVLTIIIYLCYILGLFTHILERDLIEFRYPLKIDIQIAIKTLNNNEASISYLDVNKKKFNYTFIHRANEI